MKQFFRRCEALLNNITMYRLVLYVLVGMVVAAFGLAALGQLGFSLLSMGISFSVLLCVAYGVNQLCAYTFSVKPNYESGIITSLILFLIVLPPTTLKATVSLGMVAFLAMASKYFLAFRGRHIFNPAAIAVAIAGLIGFSHAGWWVATPPLLPVVLVGGALVVWKIRHVAMVGIFLGVSLLVIAWSAILGHHDITQTLQTAITSFPLLFMGTIMLTEPQTAPTVQRWQYIYAVLVAGLANAHFAYWLSPEVALVIGNLLAFAVGARRRISLTLQSVTELAPRTYEIILKPEVPLAFRPGQYLELSLPHAHADAYGSRRMFSIAATPREGLVRLGITHSEPASSFKNALIHLATGTKLSATQTGGDFVLDKSDRPLVFLAGGIGITPFRALLTQLAELQSSRTVTLLYMTRSPEALVWQDFFAGLSKQLNFTYVPVAGEATGTWRGATGQLRTELLTQYAPEVAKATVYVSGPPAFVHAATSLLHAAHVPIDNIKTDYFSGY